MEELPQDQVEKQVHNDPVPAEPEYTLEEIIAAGIANCKRACAPYGALAALDVGPLGELLEPNGTLAFEDAVAEYGRIVRAGVAAGADLVFLETFTDLYELKAALLAVKENSSLPVLASMSFEAGGRTFTGCTVESFAATARGLGADAVGINCSLGPKEIFPMAKRLAEAVPGSFSPVSADIAVTAAERAAEEILPGSADMPDTERHYMLSLSRPDGSRAELAEKSGDPKAAEVELHRPYIDEVTFTCPDCGKVMHRVPEVIDCWFDSGAMPFAQYHYPFENKDVFEKQFPAQFISEAVDQTRGWFHSLMAESTLLFNKAPYENVIVLGHVQDENGQKMSKSKGNAVDPFDALENYGADAIRWYFYVNSAPWLPNRFHGKAVTEGQRKFMGTLWNTYAFYVLYAEIDQFNPTEHTLEYDKLSIMDRWLLSRLYSTVKEVDEDLANYKIPETAKALQSFVEDMSNWYVRRCRDRFWAKGMEQDKMNAYMTLYTALVTISKAAAPMIPFMTESIYQNLVCNLDSKAPESIHLCDFPKVKEEWIDKELETQMKQLLDIVVLGRACRNTANIKNRQPIGKMYVKAEGELSDFYKEIIADELNVKEVVFTNDTKEFTTYQFKPQLRTLGRRFGSRLNELKEVLAGLDGNATMDALNASGEVTVTVGGVDEVLATEDLLVETAQMDGYVSEEDHGITVVLDTNLTPELIEEGFVREVISKIQTMRKDAGFEVVDHIRVYEQGNDKIKEIIKTNESQIKADVLADEVILDKTEGYTADWKINGEAVTLGVAKVEA